MEFLVLVWDIVCSFRAVNCVSWSASLWCVIPCQPSRHVRKPLDSCECEHKLHISSHFTEKVLCACGSTLFSLHVATPSGHWPLFRNQCIVSLYLQSGEQVHRPQVFHRDDSPLPLLSFINVSDRLSDGSPTLKLSSPSSC